MSQDGDTLEYMLAWIKEEPVKGGILFIVSFPVASQDLQTHARACSRTLLPDCFC